jgi:hypothetical protein
MDAYLEEQATGIVMGTFRGTTPLEFFVDQSNLSTIE